MAKYVVEKIGNGQKLCNCANSQLGGGMIHADRGDMERGCQIFVGDLHNAYVVVKYEFWLSLLWKKLAMVKDFVIVQIVNGGGVHTDRGGMERGCQIFVGDLHNAFVLKKYELWPSVLLKKLPLVKDYVKDYVLCIVQKVNWGGGGATDHLTIGFV